MFGLLLASGGVAMCSGIIWVAFLPGMIRSQPPPRPEPERWYLPRNAVLALAATVFVLSAFTVSNSSHGSTTADRYFLTAIVGTGVLVVGLFVVALGRYRATGVWPSGRRAPWGSFWLLPVIFVAAVGCGVWALLTMTTSMVPTAGPC
jgi:amino acid transporter